MPDISGRQYLKQRLRRARPMPSDNTHNYRTRPTNPHEISRHMPHGLALCTMCMRFGDCIVS